MSFETLVLPGTEARSVNFPRSPVAFMWSFAVLTRDGISEVGVDALTMTPRHSNTFSQHGSEIVFLSP